MITIFPAFSYRRWRCCVSVRTGNEPVWWQFLSRRCDCCFQRSGRLEAWACQGADGRLDNGQVNNSVVLPYSSRVYSVLLLCHMESANRKSAVHPRIRLSRPVPSSSPDNVQDAPSSTAPAPVSQAHHLPLARPPSHLSLRARSKHWTHCTISPQGGPSRSSSSPET